MTPPLGKRRWRPLRLCSRSGSWQPARLRAGLAPPGHPLPASAARSMADTVPGYMRPTSAATNRRATLGKVATNQPRPLKPSAASSGKAGLASSKPLGASGVSDSGSAALGSSSGPGQPKDILKAKELVLDAKAAETTGEPPRLFPRPRGPGRLHIKGLPDTAHDARPALALVAGCPFPPGLRPGATGC